MICYLKYGNRFWHKAPFWFIPASLLWAGLEILIVHFKIVERICNKFPDSEDLVKKSVHVLCCCISYLATALAIYMIKFLTGIDLLDFGIR